MSRVPQATLSGVDFVSITLPVTLTNETVDAALQQLRVSTRRMVNPVTTTSAHDHVVLNVRLNCRTQGAESPSAHD